MAIDVSEILENSIDKVEDLSSSYLTLEHIIPNLVEKFTTEGNTLRMLNKELGTGSKVSAALRKELADLSGATGLTTKAQMELLGVTKEFHQGIVASTASTLKFQKATGVSVDIIGKLSAKLNILGTTSDSKFRSMYENILSIREQFGLTAQQIDSLTSSLTSYATIVGSLNIDNAAKGIGVFLSKLTSIGLEAEDATKMIEDMLNPDLVTESIPLWTKLGISVNDVIAGDPTTKLEAAIPKLRDLAVQITDMAKNNRFAANEMAKVYGLTLAQANQLAKLSTEESNKAIKTLEQYRSEVTTFMSSMKEMFTSVGGTLASVVLDPISKIASRLTDSINQGGFALKGALTAGVVFATGFVYKKIKGLSQRAAKFFNGVADTFNSIAGNMSKDMAGYARNVQGKSDIKKKEVAGIRGIKSREIDAQMESPEGGLSRFAKRSMDISEKHAAELRSFRGKESNADKLQRIAELANGPALTKELDDVINYLESIEPEKRSALQKNTLEDLKTKQKIIANQQKALREALNNEVMNFSFDATDFGERYIDRYKDLLEKGAKEQADAVIEQYSSTFTNILPQEIKTTMKDIMGDTDAVKAAMLNNSENMASFFDSVKSYYDNIMFDSSRTDEERASAFEKLQQLKESRKKLAEAESQNLGSIDDMVDQLTTQMGVVNRELKDQYKITKHPFQLLKQATENIVLSFHTFGMRLWKKAKEAAEEAGGWSKLISNTIGKGIKGAVGFIGKNIGKFALGGLAAGAGALISKAKDDQRVQETLDKVSEMANKFMDKLLTDDLLNSITNMAENIMPSVENLLNTIGPALSDLLMQVAPFISTLAEKLMPVITLISRAVAWVASWLVPIITKVATGIASVVNWVTRLFGKNTEIAESTAQTAKNTTKTPDTLVSAENLSNAYVATLRYENKNWKLVEQGFIDLHNIVEAGTKNIAGEVKETKKSINDSSDYGLGH